MALLRFGGEGKFSVTTGKELSYREKKGVRVNRFLSTPVSHYLAVHYHFNIQNHKYNTRPQMGTTPFKMAQLTRGAVSLHRGGTYRALCFTCITSKWCILMHRPGSALYECRLPTISDCVRLRYLYGFLATKRGLGSIAQDRIAHARTRTHAHLIGFCDICPSY